MKISDDLSIKLKKSYIFIMIFMIATLFLFAIMVAQSAPHQLKIIFMIG